MDPSNERGTHDIKSVPHSGKAGFEQPVRDFDKTPLSEAVAQDLLKVPSDPSTLAAEHAPKKSKRGLFIGLGGAAAGLAVGIGAMIGINGGGDEAPKPTTIETPDTTGEAPTEVETPEAPAEAQAFMDAYSEQYVDPLAVYYAETAYEQNHMGANLSQDYVDTYDFEAYGFDGEVSPLGFQVLKVDPNAEVSAETMVNTFNEATPTLNTLINLLAKNPNADQLEVIRDEFSKYTGLGTPESANVLVDRLLAATAEYGPTANYTIVPATITDNPLPGETVLIDRQPAIDAVDENERVTGFSGSFDIAINVENYDNANQVTTATTVIEDLQMTVNYATNDDPMNIGYVGLGSK